MGEEQKGGLLGAVKKYVDNKKATTGREEAFKATWAPRTPEDKPFGDVSPEDVIETPEKLPTE